MGLSSLDPESFWCSGTLVPAKGSKGVGGVEMTLVRVFTILLG